MDTFQRGHIWLVNFEPSFGHEYKKVRPALIIQSNKYIGSSNLLTIIPISSQVSKQSGLDILLEKDSQNRLLSDSLIKIKQISSFDKRRFIKFIGNVNKDIMEKVENTLDAFLKDII
ncbi:MAG: type II toxin-antitoxin system PemK/MazF family toxin [Candidatus Scalindua sp.]